MLEYLKKHDPLKNPNFQKFLGITFLVAAMANMINSYTFFTDMTEDKLASILFLTYFSVAFLELILVAMFLFNNGRGGFFIRWALVVSNVLIVYASFKFYAYTYL